MEDQGHIERIRQGDKEAFAFLVQRYKAPAYSIALKILKNSGDAEEVVQEAFVRAFHSINQFREESKFSTWLYRIVYNTSISQIRTNRKSSMHLEDVPEDYPDFHELNDALKLIADKEVRGIIQKALEELNETDFTILTLYYYEDKSLKEIARVLGIKHSNAKVKIQRARVKLHDALRHVLKTEIYDLI
ncbi:MAG TPA: sigma-70 family RNA polymerase sigma factor [Bacteroidales bacterium]|nr:sigma-70 family RNA polymerase sigma factor [Bacteroidales bacterium]